MVLDVAGSLGPDVIDVDELATAIDDGRHRAAVTADFAVARTDEIQGSPTFRLPDGTAETGLTGAQWSLSDFPAIMRSVRSLADRETAVHPGHGPSTTTAAERPRLSEWERRGW